MTAYLVVYGRDPKDRFAAYRFETHIKARNSAARLTPNVPENADDTSGGCFYVIEKPEDVTFSGQLLAQVYSALTGEQIDRFDYRWEGVTSLMEALNKWAADAPTTRGRKPVEGRMTMRQQMDHYNSLVDEAHARGLTKFRHLGGANRMNTFATYASGEAAIEKIKHAIAETEERVERLEEA